ncbi:MAG: hypothetical protein Q8P20_09905 [bacterium]|nr:hypothetical protein [bacterium]
MDMQVKKESRPGLPHPESAHNAIVNLVEKFQEITQSHVDVDKYVAAIIEIERFGSHFTSLQSQCVLHFLQKLITSLTKEEKHENP